MCRWLAYSGAPILLDEVLFKTDHSLIDQSLHASDAATTTNGDGFGLGWYGKRDVPGVYKDIRPAWNDKKSESTGRADRVSDVPGSRPGNDRLTGAENELQSFQSREVAVRAQRRYKRFRQAAS